MMVVLIVLTGLMAGIYFAFSVFVMRALSELPPLQGAQAMNQINVVILKTIFLPIFFGTSLWYVGLIAWHTLHWQGMRSMLIIVAACCYIIGMFFVTALGNVPMNNQLQANANNPAALMQYWQTYRRQWTALNHVRMMTCVVSCALLTIALNH